MLKMAVGTRMECEDSDGDVSHWIVANVMEIDEDGKKQALVTFVPVDQFEVNEAQEAQFQQKRGRFNTDTSRMTTMLSKGWPDARGSE